MISLRCSRSSFSAKKHANSIRSKVLVRLDLVFYHDVNIFCDPTFLTLRTARSVMINSKSEKSPVLFGGFQVRNEECGPEVCSGIPNYMIIAKTSRRLFSIRALSVKWQLAIRIYSFFMILCRQIEGPQTEGIQRVETTAPRDSTGLIPVLGRKENRMVIGHLISEYGVSI